MSTHYNFSTKWYGLCQDRGWAAWLGRLGQGFHVHLRRATRYDRFRSFISAHIGWRDWQFASTIVKYRTGGELPWHFDAAPHQRHLGIVVVLKPSGSGGQFEHRGKKPYFVSKHLIIFDGNECEHRVTKITNGNRWIVMFHLTAPRR